jgi:hypothetical protein
LIFKKLLSRFVTFSSLKARVNKGEQGESNAEGMGCTQQELQQPCSFQSMQSRFILVFKEKRRIVQFFNV